MNLNFDSIIFIGFLIANITLGLASSKGIKSIREYAVGDRDFTTPTIVATIVATWVSGEFFFNNIYESYAHGLNFIWTAILGDFFSILLVGAVFAPRMGEFLGKLSVAEAMGDLFGTRVRVITSIAGFIGSCGLIAIQLKMAGFIFEYALNLPGIYGVLIASVIVTLYSSLGGIKSVTFTDVIQFLTFSIVIPVIAYTLLSSVSNIDAITATLVGNPLFDYKTVFDFSNAASMYYLFIFLFFVIPGFTPAFFQRIAMAKNVSQASSSFIIAAFICMLLVSMVDWIGVLALFIDPSLSPHDVVKNIIFESSYVGLKGAALVGIMAMIMSTVDSYINATSVLVVHDFLKPLKVNLTSNELVSARFMSLLIGIFSFFLSTRDKGLLDLMIITYSFYLPVVTVPFIMAILGFRSSEKSVLVGMTAGISTIILWDYILKIEAVNSIPFGVLMNLIGLMGTHYLCKQEGGWVGIKDEASFLAIRNKRRQRIASVVDAIKNFNIIQTCKRNYPSGEGMISLLGLFVMIVTFSSVNNLAMQPNAEIKNLLNILYPITLGSCSALISYPLWLQSWKDSKFIAIIWNFIMFCVLICFSFFMVLISNFTDIQLMVFMINIVVIVSLIKWHWALINITAGIVLTTILCNYYIDTGSIADQSASMQFKTVYFMLLASSSFILFLKPKQEHIEATEHKVEHYSKRIEDQAHEIERLGATAERVLNNVNHELRLPIGNVINFAEMLSEALSKSGDHLVKELADEMYENSARVSSMILNMLDLATLDAKKVQLDKSLINFSELVQDRAYQCYKIYKNDKQIDLYLDIEPEIMISVDPNYMRQTIDNLVINAINFSNKGSIMIRLAQKENKVEFSIEDQGLGIPATDLWNIFTPFKMGGNTESKAQGRGVGLALCKSAIEAHGGEISAQSDGIQGAKLSFYLKYYTY